MPVTSKVRQSVLDAKERLEAGRKKVKLQHESGSPGIQVSAHLSDLLDTILLDLIQAALEDLEASGARGYMWPNRRGASRWLWPP